MSARPWNLTDRGEWWSDFHGCVLAMETACTCLRRVDEELWPSGDCARCSGTGRLPRGHRTAREVLALGARPSLTPKELDLLGALERLHAWGVRWFDRDAFGGRP